MHGKAIWVGHGEKCTDDPRWMLPEGGVGRSATTGLHVWDKLEVGGQKPAEDRHGGVPLVG